MTSVRDEVLTIINQVSRPRQLDLNNENIPLLHLGLDFLDYASVLMAIEDKYGFQIQEGDLEGLGSLREIVTFIESKRASPNS